MGGRILVCSRRPAKRSHHPCPTFGKLGRASGSVKSTGVQIERIDRPGCCSGSAQTQFPQTTRSNEFCRWAGKSDGFDPRGRRKSRAIPRLASVRMRRLAARKQHTGWTGSKWVAPATNGGFQICITGGRPDPVRPDPGSPPVTGKPRDSVPRDIGMCPGRHNATHRWSPPCPECVPVRFRARMARSGDAGADFTPRCLRD